MRLKKLFGVFLLSVLIFADWQPATVAQTVPTAGASAPKRYALLIGVEGYERVGNKKLEWDNLQTKPDVMALKDVLIKRFKFVPSDIKILNTRESTTKAAIEQGFKDLIAQVKPGDIVYLHYSGHGAQIEDDNGDEIDGLDESLIPSDYKTSEDGSNNIRDDEIGMFIDQLKAKSPSSVMFTFDSCFSGTITRGGTGRYAVRGKKERPVVSKKPTPKAGAAEKQGLLENATASNGFVVISATRNDQLAKEDSDGTESGSMGALSYALVKALRDSTPTTTYADLFQSVRNSVEQRVPDQNPQIEGSIDNVIMRGIAIPSEPYINVGKDDNEKPILQAGSIQGMTKGSRFVLLPNGAKSSDEPGKLADAEIVEVYTTTSLLKLTPVAGKKIDPAILPNVRAFETAHNYEDTALKVFLPPGNNFSQKAEITADLQKFPLVALTTKDDWSIKIEQAAGTTKLALIRADSSKIADIENDSEAAKNIRLALQREYKFRTLLGLESSSSDINVEMRIVPVECETNQSKQCVKVLRDKETSKDANAQPTLGEGDYFQIEFRNTGIQAAYVTALELTSAGVVNPVFPHPDVTMADNKILADGKWKRIPLPFVFVATPPYGKYIYKAVATPDQTDFSSLVDKPLKTRGPNDSDSKEAQSPLGKLLQSASSGTTTRGKIAGAAPPNWSTATVGLEVKQKK